MIAAALTLYWIEIVGRLARPLLALRSVDFSQFFRGGWLASCAASALLPLAASLLVIYLAIHLAGA